MIDPNGHFQKTRKLYALLEDFFCLNGFTEGEALNTIDYYMIISFTANNINSDEIDKLFKHIKNEHLELMKMEKQ